MYTICISMNFFMMSKFFPFGYDKVNLSFWIVEIGTGLEKLGLETLLW